jgi:thioredoxin reductase
MTSAMDLPLFGKVKLTETSKRELLDVWHKALDKNDISVKENSKVESIEPVNGYFKITTLNGDEFKAKTVLLSIGRRGTPRKLNVPGENTEKVAYRLLEPELIEGKDILVVGGGDSAIESALMLGDKNRVTLSYRNDVFQRIKPKNSERINEAIQNGSVVPKFMTNVIHIRKEDVILSHSDTNEEIVLKNDLVYIFAGGELPTQFLKKIGLEITTKYGDAILKHQ